MKKLTIAGLITLAVLISACEPGMPTGLVVNEVDSAELLLVSAGADDTKQELPDQDTDTTGNQDQIIMTAGFDHFSLSTYGVSAIITGQVNVPENGKPISGATILLSCEGEQVAQATTAEDGYFEFLIKTECGFGKTVWAEIDYDGKRYMSEKRTIPTLIPTLLSSGTTIVRSDGGDSQSSINAAGVPEFTPATLAIAAIGVLLTVALLRREQ